jgi:hypothetical protein
MMHYYLHPTDPVSDLAGVGTDVTIIIPNRLVSLLKDEKTKRLKTPFF